MAFTWTDIENKQDTGAIREALNELGVNIGEIIQFKRDVQVARTAWASDSTYADFPYRVDIPMDSITSADIPVVIFNTKEALSGNYLGAVSGDGVVSVWCELSEQAITIPLVAFIKEG